MKLMSQKLLNFIVNSLMRVTATMLELFPYQQLGAEWLASKERAGLLDAPGVGKGAQTIRALDMRNAKRGVIICPAHLRVMWHAEFKKFALVSRRICRGATIHDLVAFMRGVFDVLVMSFESATKWAKRLYDHAEIFDFVVVDEFHYCTNLSAARTRAVIGHDGDGVGGLVMWGAQSWVLTGTPMSNDPAGCYTFLKFVGVTDLPYATFLRRYFHSRSTTWGTRNKVKADRVEELREMITRHSIRRTLVDVGHQLPPIFLTTHLVEGDTSAVRELLAAHPGLDEAIVRAVRDGGLSFLDAQHVATMRRLVGEAKALPYAELLLSELDEDPERKVVVMGISRQALQTVHEVLEKRGHGAVLVQGGVPDRDREARVRAFQTDPACRVFVGNMRAAGTGLTLTAAAHVDVLESDWTPAANDQAIKRVRRIGQTRTQRARFIMLANSIDEVVVRVVAEKCAAIAAVDNEPMVAAPPTEAA